MKPRTYDMTFCVSKCKKKCDYTGKMVAVYQITPEGIERRFSK